MSLRRWGRIAGPLAAVLLYAWIPDTLPDPAGGELVLGRAGRITGAVVAWMAIWWMTECISIFVTALLPALVLPLTGIQELPETTALYAHPLIFLAMGGFVLALALERWELHRRFAVFILGAVGTGPRRLVGGFMIVSAHIGHLDRAERVYDCSCQPPPPREGRTPTEIPRRSAGRSRGRPAAPAPHR